MASLEPISAETTGELKGKKGKESSVSYFQSIALKGAFVAGGTKREGKKEKKKGELSH